MDLKLDQLDSTALVGFVVGTVGAVLALVPQLEQMIAVAPGWPEALVMAVVSGIGLFGLILATRGRQTEGGVIAGVMGIVIAVLGPIAPGVLVVLGAALLFAASRPTDVVSLEPAAAEDA